MQCSQWWEGYNSAARGVMEGPATRMCVWGAVNRHVLGVRLWCNDVVYGTAASPCLAMLSSGVVNI